MNINVERDFSSSAIKNFNSSSEAYEALNRFDIKFARFENDKIKGQRIKVIPGFWRSSKNIENVEFTISELPDYTKNIISYFKINRSTCEVKKLSACLKAAIVALKTIILINTKNANKAVAENVVKYSSASIELLENFCNELLNIQSASRLTLLATIGQTLQTTVESCEKTYVALLHNQQRWSFSQADLDHLLAGLESASAREATDYAERASKLFNENYEVAMGLARILNVEFCREYNSLGAKSYNKKTGEISVNSKQLIAALEMARNSFPEMLQLANTPEDRIKASRLIQIIIFNENIQALPLPKSSECFFLSDLPEVSEKDPLPKNTSYLMHALKEVRKKSPKENLLNIGMDFTADAVQRGVEIAFRDFPDLEDESKKIDVNQTLRYNVRDPCIVDLVRQHYVNFLTKNPEETLRIVNENNVTSAFTHQCTQLVKDAADFQHSTFPSIIFEEIMEKSMSYWNMSQEERAAATASLLEAGFEVVDPSEEIEKAQYQMSGQIKKLLMCEMLEKIGEASKLSDAEIVSMMQAMESQKCPLPDVRQIEPLMRMKLVEMIIYLNQATYFKALTSLKNLEAESEFLKKEGVVPEAGENGLESTFTYTSPSFDAYVNTINFKIFTTEKRFFENEGVVELFDHCLTCLGVQTFYEVPSLVREDDERPEPSVGMRFKFNYQAPTTVINNLVTHFNK